MKKLKGRGKYFVMNGKALRKIGENGVTIQYALLFSFGILFSALWMKSKGEVGLTAQFAELCLRYYKLKGEQGILTNTLDSLLISGFFLFWVFVAGFSVIGCMWLGLLSLLRGALMGIAIATLYRTNTTVGLGYTAVVLLPYVSVCAVAFILSCKQSKAFSRGIAENGIREGGRQCRGVLMNFVLKQGVILLITLGACFTGSVLQRLFGGFFTIV